MMNCDALPTMLGFECREVKTLWNDPAVSVATPFSFTDGEAIGFYLIRHKGSVRITDNGDTIAHLINMGLGYDDGRRWAALRTRIEPFQARITDAGEIEAIASQDQADALIASYLSAIMAIVSYERESLGTPDDVHIFVEEVGMLLKAWKPGSKIVERPTIAGQSSRSHTFDYAVDNLLVEAISPHASSSGSLLRKAGDVMSGPAADKYSVMAVIDDRFDPVAAEMEKNIISTLAGAALYTKLESRIHRTRSNGQH